MDTDKQDTILIVDDEFVSRTKLKLIMENYGQCEAVEHGKDAIAIFGRGCTSELISDQGLLLTNHHCGYGRIQAHSSAEHD